MRRHLIRVTVALLVAFAPATVRGQARSKPAELPATRVVIFSCGLAYFQRAGQVEGDARIDLQFPAAAINDLLKSLVLQDMNGGTVGSVIYDNRDPVDRSLRSLAIDLASNPTLSQLLQRLRGESVEITLVANKANPAPLTGLIMGVETQTRLHDTVAKVDADVLNLLTSEGIRSVGLEHVQRVRLLRAELDQEYRRALGLLAATQDERKKTLSLHFHGNGKRAVRVGYITESPIWKTTYRLALLGDKAFLQGWAIVENTTEEDWNNVKLGLISGRPISFRMDLYEPLHVERPIVEPELFASLRPPLYSGPIEGTDRLASALRGMNRPLTMGALGVAGGMGALGAAGFGGGGFGGNLGQQGGLGLNRPQAPGGFFGGGINRPADEEPAGRNDRRQESVNFREGVMNAAIASQLGDQYQYLIEKPVNLPRHKSAMIPIVIQDTRVARLSIFNEVVHKKHPMLGVRFKNGPNLHLMQGPVTVFADDGYAGEMRLPDLRPLEVRLLSYAIDLGTEVNTESREEAEVPQSVKIAQGTVLARYKARRSNSYTVRNLSGQDRTVLLEHPFDASWQVVNLEKRVERSREWHRFEVQASAGKTVKHEVIEELTRERYLALHEAKETAIQEYLRIKILSPKVTAALNETLAFKAKLADAQALTAAQTQAIASIERDQERLRLNIEKLPPTSDAYKRYVKKFDDQETDIERRRQELARLQLLAEQQHKALAIYLENLNVE